MEHGDNLDSIRPLAIEHAVWKPLKQGAPQSVAHLLAALWIAGDLAKGGVNGKLEIC